MIALLVLLLARDEVADQIAKLRQTADLAQQYQIANTIQQAVKANHVGLLHKEIDAGPAAIRPHLVRALGRINTRDSAAALKALCQKHEVASRAESAYQLRVLGDDSGMKLLPAFLAGAQTDEDKRQVLYKMYGGMAAPADVVPALLQFLGSEKNVHLRRQTLQVLGTHKDPKAVEALRKIAADPADEMRHEALAAGIRAGDEKALESGIQALEAGKMDAISTYSLVSAIQGSGQKAVAPRLRAVLEKTVEVNLKVALIRALAGLKDDKSIPLLTKLQEDPNASVAKAAMSAVLELGGKAQADTLKKMAAEGDPFSRIEAAEALLRQDNLEGYAGIKAELEGKTSAYRTRAILVLGQVRRKESVELLLPLLDDADATVKAQARSSLLQVLAALYPYQKFDDKASAEKIRLWWEKQR